MQPLPYYPLYNVNSFGSLHQNPNFLNDVNKHSFVGLQVKQKDFSQLQNTLLSNAYSNYGDKHNYSFLSLNTVLISFHQYNIFLFKTKSLNINVK